MISPHELPEQILPDGPWKALFANAMVLIQEIQAVGGGDGPFWTLGGGTVLMFRYDHRASKDIDIFVPDPHYLGYVTPRLSDTAAAMTANYVEDASSYVKLEFAEGEIDFVASPNLMGDAWEWWNICGHAVRVERPAEIIAKKMYHRGQRATARDLFDLCTVIERDPEGLSAAAPFLLRYRTQFIERINSRSTVLEATFEEIDMRGYRPTLQHCISTATAFLRSL